MPSRYDRYFMDHMPIRISNACIRLVDWLEVEHYVIKKSVLDEIELACRKVLLLIKTKRHLNRKRKALGLKHG